MSDPQIFHDGDADGHGLRWNASLGTRRRVYRNQRLYALPYGCTTIRNRGGVQHYYWAGTWYRPASEGETVMCIEEEIDPGAETKVEFEA